MQLLIRNPIRNSQKNLSSGFTLIELLIVILLISIIASMGFVSVRSFSERQALSLESEKFSAALHLARSRAQSQVKPDTGSCATNASLQGYQVSIACNASGNNCVRYRLSAVCGGTEVIIQQDNFPSTMSVTATGNFGINQQRILFETVTGQVASIIGPVRVNFRDNGGNTKYVEITKDGAITHD